jgi:protoheme IX farnesyltransferase
VVFSSVVSYLIVPEGQPTITKTLLLFLGGLLVTGAANASNEIWEKDIDQLMRRTMMRPLPEGRMGKMEASIFAGLTLFSGLYILYTVFNPLSSLLALLSYLLYVLVYTPLKTRSPISTMVGAIPGALPCVIGWVSATNHLGSLAAWTLFIIQFFWQFPHFWAIAWVAHEDYKRAGMKMLPRHGKVGYFTAFQCVLYSAVLIPLSILPSIAGLGSWISITGLLIAGIWYLYNSILFLKDNSDVKARKVMFASFIYLPVALISLLLDRYF